MKKGVRQGRRKYSCSVKRIAACMLCMCLFFGLLPQPARAEDVSDTSWYNSTDTEFTLYDADDLAGFADLVNEGNSFEGKTVKLGQDISLESMEDYWVPIGYNSSTPFSGTFDGAGYTVSGMNVVADGYGGFFGNLSNASVKGLTVKGAVIMTSSFGGGIAAYVSSSEISGCTSYVNISASAAQWVSYLGGIAGTIFGSSGITDCANYGKVISRSPYAANIGGIAGSVNGKQVKNCRNYGEVTGAYDVGGIVGNVQDAYNEIAEIEGCINEGSISNVAPYSDTISSMIGGIAGTLNETAAIQMCANKGTVSGTANGIGGIVGKELGNISCCYNSGTVSSNNSSADAFLGGIAGSMENGTLSYSYNIGKIEDGADYAALTIGDIAGKRTGGTIKKVFATNSTCESAVGDSGSTSGITVVAADTMKTAEFLSSINRADYAVFAADSEGAPVNGGYPVLYWELETGNRMCTITIEDSNHGKVSVSETTVPYGSYVDLSAEAEIGYKFSSYQVNGAATTTDRLLVTADMTVGGNFVMLTSGVMVFPAADGYTVQVRKDGLIRNSDGSFEEVEGLEVKDGDRVYEGDELFFDILFSAEPEDKDMEYIADISGSYINESYGQYWVTAVSGGKVAFTVTAKEERKSWGTLADISWYNQTDSVFTLTSAEELAGLALLVREGLDDFSGKTVELGADISLKDPKGGTREWTPIGSGALINLNLRSASDSTLCPDYFTAFCGTFDGNSHTIGDFYMDTTGVAEPYQGLFGVVQSGLVSDLTVRGTLVNSKQYYNTFQGGIAGLLYQSEVRRCVSDVDITNKGSAANNVIVSWRSMGGIAGKIMAESIISHCVNQGDISQSSWVYSGGITGYQNAGCTVEYSENYGCVMSSYVSSLSGGEVFAGGICGFSLGSIFACVNEGTILHTGGKADAERKNWSSIGGITGSGSAVACCNKGEVQGGLYTECVGGIVGSTYLAIEGCYNSGPVSSQFAHPAATLRVGGICGYLLSSGTISGSYNIGKISHPEDSTLFMRAGGVCGISEGTAENPFVSCYFLASTCEYAADNQDQYDGITMFYRSEVTEADSGFAEALNGKDGNYFCEDDIGANDGYPVLFFEQVIGLQVMKQPDKTEYTAFETFSPAGMKIAAVFGNGETDEVAGYSFSTEPLTVDIQEVTVSYTDAGGTIRSVGVPVTVLPYDLAGIASVTLAQESYSYIDGAFVYPVIESAYDAEGRAMEEYTDYEVEYQKNQDAGTGVLILKGAGNYTGSAEVEFDITRRSIQGMTAELSQSSYIYNGKACCPKVTIEGLTEGKDFTVDYRNNQNAGSAAAVITGQGNYTGTIEAPYQISPKPLASSGVTLSQTAYIYNGKNDCKPGVTVKDGSQALKNGTDYTVTYTGYDKIGTAKVTVKGSGNYSGTVSKDYSIGLAAPAIKSVTNVASGITVKWSKVEGASGYKVYRKKGSGGYQLVGTAAGGSKVKYTDKTAKNGIVYTYMVRAYYGKLLGGYQEGVKTVRLTAPAIKSVRAVGTKAMAMNWTKSKKATGYQIWYSTTKKFKTYKKVTGKSAKIVSKNIKKLKPGKKYYVKIRAYKKSGKTVYYSSWSSAKNVKLSK